MASSVAATFINEAFFLNAIGTGTGIAWIRRQMTAV